MTTLPDMPVDVNAMIAGTASMTNAQLGMYWRLLLYQWKYRAVPDDQERLRAIAPALPRQFGKDWSVVSEKFDPIGDGKLRNQKLEEVRASLESAQITHADHANHAPESAQNTQRDLRAFGGESAQSALLGEGGVLGGRGSGEEPSLGEEEEPKRAKTRYSLEFNAFWRVFPSFRKRDKPRAWRAWKRAIKSVDSALLETSGGAPLETPAEYLIRRAAEYAASELGRSEFAKMPASWLNSGAWEDPPESWEMPKKATTKGRGSDWQEQYFGGRKAK